MRRWTRSMRASWRRGASRSTSAAMWAIASAAFAGSGRAWWRWSRSRCARALSANMYAGDADVTLIEAACGDETRHADAADQLGQSHCVHRVRRFHQGGRRRWWLGRPDVGPGDRGAVHDARRLGDPVRRARLCQGRRRGLRGHGVGGTVAAAAGPFLRVHHDPARRGPAVSGSASLARALRLRSLPWARARC